jgi:tetraacyldisaccharide 4'-kinase
VISIDRVAAVRMLLQNSACNIVLSDDGLQHYRLGRDLEICIVDGMRQFGNQQLLPAGPLRESVKRLQQIPFVLVNGENLQIKPQKIISLLKPQQITDFDHFQGVKVHAVAAIGHPQRFFALLRAQGLDIIEHIFPDHYLYSANDIIFADEFPVIMTEKDAIKCRKFADARHWYVAIHAVVEPQILEKINNRIKNLRSAYAIH